MKKFVLLLMLLFFKSYCFSQVQLSLLNKTSTITDTIFFQVKNQTKDTIHFNFSIEVFSNDQWIELYGNIYEFDRDKIQRFKVLPERSQNFKYSTYRIAPDYRKIYTGKTFRLIMNLFPANPLNNLKKIKSKAFKIK